MHIPDELQGKMSIDGIDGADGTEKPEILTQF